MVKFESLKQIIHEFKNQKWRIAKISSRTTIYSQETGIILDNEKFGYHSVSSFAQTLSLRGQYIYGHLGYLQQLCS